MIARLRQIGRGFAEPQQHGDLAFPHLEREHVEQQAHADHNAHDDRQNVLSHVNPLSWLWLVELDLFDVGVDRVFHVDADALIHASSRR